MPKLNPPSLDSTLPAFYLDDTTTLKIPFGLNRSVGINEISGIRVVIKTVQTNTEKYSGIFKLSNASAKESAENGIAIFTNVPLNTFIPGQYYKVQMCFEDQSSTPIQGYPSSVSIMKCTYKPQIFIEGLQAGSNNQSKYSYTGVYSNNDSNEKVYNYTFNIYDEDDNIFESSGELLHNVSDNNEITSSNDIWYATKSLTPGKTYSIEYKITTINGLIDSSDRYIIKDMELIPPPTWFDGELHAILHPDDAYIELKLYGNKLYGNFVLSRSSSKDNFTNWSHISNFTFSIENMAVNGVTLWKDFTIEQGVEYLYAIQMKSDYNVYSIHMVNQSHKIKADFEDMFLYDGKRQLKIRFNPKVNSFKNTVLETKTDTIGNQFPFFFRNGQVSYKEFPISGLISMLMDDNQLFIETPSIVSQTRIRTNSEDILINSNSTQLIADNVKKEREFKLEVLQWLQNGELKLFKSPNEGNYIVRLLNVSTSPNDTLGRMIHTFTCTAYESAENTIENLKLYKYLNIKDSNIIDRIHFSTSLHINEAPYKGIQVLGNDIISQNNLYMYNINLKNLTPYATIEFFNSRTGSTTKRTANEYGEIKLPSSEKWKGFRIPANDDISLNLAILDFDYIYTLSNYSGWNTYKKYKTVTPKGLIHMKNIYSDISTSGTLSSDNTYDYLSYLNNKQGQVGEVLYVYIRKRHGLTQEELNNISYEWSIKSFNKSLEEIVAGGGRVFKDCGILSELKCGTGFDVDIVYAQKEIGI